MQTLCMKSLFPGCPVGKTTRTRPPEAVVTRAPKGPATAVEEEEEATAEEVGTRAISYEDCLKFEKKNLIFYTQGQHRTEQQQQQGNQKQEAKRRRKKRYARGR